MPKIQFVELKDGDALFIASELAHCMNEGVATTNLLALYTIMYQGYLGIGECDHEVGICVCDLKRALHTIASAFQFPDTSSGGEWSYPGPTLLREHVRRHFQMNDICEVKRG